jgi:hypothetical protein
MRDAAEIDADILDAAREIHNSAAAMGKGYRALLTALNEHYKEVFQSGGGLSAVDFTAHADPERVRTDIIGLLTAAGLSDVLIQAAGKPWKPESQFYQRYESLVESGHLTASRGQPSPDPLSAYAHPGVKVHSRGSVGHAPGAKVI